MHAAEAASSYVCFTVTPRLDSAPQRVELVAHDVHARDEGQQEVPEEVQEPVSAVATRTFYPGSKRLDLF